MKFYLPVLNEVNLYLVSLTFVFVIVLLSNSMSQQHVYSDSWGPHGFSLTQSKASEVEINYSIHSFDFGKEQINNE